MGVSGNSVAGKSFQMFTVSKELLQKVVEAVQAGEKKARSSGDIQSLEVFCHGFRQNISLGRVMIVPPSVCSDRKNFPTALLHGALVRIFGTGGEEIADLVEKKIGESEFDEYSQADFDSLKESLFVDKRTDKEACLIVFAPNWLNSREYISFHFTKDSEELKNNLRHQVFAAYFDPRVSSAFNALMTNVDTTHVDVTDITPKLNFPYLAENILKEYPRLDKQASKQKPTILLNHKTADEVEKKSLEPAELNVFDALDQALENSLLPSVEDAESAGGREDYKAPVKDSGVPRAAAVLTDKEAEIMMPKGFVPHEQENQGQAPMFQPLTGSKKKAELTTNPPAAHETPFTNVGPGRDAADEQKAMVPAAKESLDDAVKQNDAKATEPIGIEIDEQGRPVHCGDDVKDHRASKTAGKATNPSNRKHDNVHPETQRVDPTRLSSAYSAAYNGGFVDKHAMPPQKVRDYMNEHMGNNSDYAPHAVADHQKLIEAGLFGEDGFNRRSDKKFGGRAEAGVNFKRSTAAFNMSPFLMSYIEAALWSSNDESTPSGGEPMDRNHDVNDIDPETLEVMRKDCELFQQKNAELLQRAATEDGMDEEHQAHDFWLTRNGHGAGFWDGDYPATGEALTKAAKEFGEANLYIGDEGKIHQYERGHEASYIASKMNKIVDASSYDASSDKTKKARANRESMLNKFRPVKFAEEEISIDTIWDEITTDIGPAPLIDVEQGDTNPAPSNTNGEQHETQQGEPSEGSFEGGEGEAEEPRTGRPNKRDIQSMPEAMRSPEPEDTKSLTDSEADWDDEIPHADGDEENTKESTWRVDAKLADFVGEVYDDVNNEEPVSDSLMSAAQSAIDSGDDIALDVATENGQMFDNVKHMQWFVEAVAREIQAEMGDYQADQHAMEGQGEVEASDQGTYVGDNNPAMMASAKTADTADNEYDIDAAANPTDKETGPSDTRECHEDYDAEHSEGTDRPKPGQGADIKTAKMGKCRKCKQNRSLNRDEVCHQCEVDSPDKEASSKRADTADNPAMEKGGEGALTQKKNVKNTRGEELPGPSTPANHSHHSGAKKVADTADNPANEDGGEGEIKVKTNKNITNTRGKELPTATSPANHSHHANKKQADTADNPYNMKDGDGAPENKKNLTVKDTTGPTPDNTKAANQNKGVKQMVGPKHDHGVDGDIAQAKGECDSPDTVDVDIPQPTVSVLDAGKRKNAKDKKCPGCDTKYNADKTSCPKCGYANPSGKHAADVSGDFSEARSGVDYDKAAIADEPAATQTEGAEEAGGRKNAAAGDEAPEEAVLDLGAGDLAGIVMTEDEGSNESAS